MPCGQIQTCNFALNIMKLRVSAGVPEHQKLTFLSQIESIDGRAKRFAETRSGSRSISSQVQYNII